jgi:hypothetical protein
VSFVQPAKVELEYEYANPFNANWPWRFDLYFELANGRKVAVEIDGKVGHSSYRAKKKREAKIAYLKSKGIELFAFPTPWVYGRKMLPDLLFYEEMHLA